MKNIVLGKVEKFYILIEIKKKPKNQQTREDAFLKIFHFLSKEKQSVLKGNEKCLIFPLLSYCLHSEEVGTLQIMFFAELVIHLKLRILVLTCDYLKNSCNINMADKLSMPSCCFFLDGSNKCCFIWCGSWCTKFVFS